ncbi:AAA-like domain-containing protein [Oscillatoria sp. FACHB-1406]|nr:AAA-like domain-containing protein [Oscillatoria sp. FACHB-1406]
MLGQVLDGRYHIIRVLEAGGFGQTYLAEDRRRPGQPECVVKQLKPLSNTPRDVTVARRLFHQEAEILEKLGNHDRIPRLLAYFEQNAEFFLVEEFIDGLSLRGEFLPGQQWTEHQVLNLLKEILPVLEFIHSFGVIHRDLKPDNIIRRASDDKLCPIDFGAVKQVRTVSGNERNPATQTVVIGTPGYIAPEQAQGNPQPNSDIYALGIIAIQALTGKKPLQFQSEPDWENNWHLDLIISPETIAVISRMVSPSYSQRYPSAKAVLEDLERRARDGENISPLSRFFQGVSRVLTTPIGELFPSSQPELDETDAETVVLETSRLSNLTLKAEATVVDRPEIVSIAYADRDIDRTLANELYQALTAEGYRVFLCPSEEWNSRANEGLEICDLFVVLLCEYAATSEMITEQVSRVKGRRDRSLDGKPAILLVRVNLPERAPLNYELRGYLASLRSNEDPRSGTRDWHSPADTPALLEELHLRLSGAPEDFPTEEDYLPTLLPAEESPSGKPLPAAEPVLPEGQVGLTSVFYIERPPIEARCYETIIQPGSLIRIKAPRQMGKTSLMARILQHAEQEGGKPVSLSFQLADGKIFADLDKFLRWFCASITRRLQIPNRVGDYWDDLFGSKENCTTYFEDYLLQEIESPIVLGLDEVDRVFEYPEIAEDFFSLLRAWHEEAKNREIWQKLRLVVVHSTEVYVRLNVNQSPFNVGLPVELPEFNGQQVQHLAQLHGLDWKAREIEPLLAAVGGHPYLVRLALYHIAKGDTTLERLLQTGASESGLYGDHLRRNLWILKQYPQLAIDFRVVVAANEPVSIQPDTAFKLYSMGLLHLSGNEVLPRCAVYRDYFRERLEGVSQIAPRPETPSIATQGSSLAAIAFTDVVDSTALSVANPTQALESMQRDFQLMREICQRYDGQVLKSMGDGLLIYFVSAVKAVDCAREIQRALAKKAETLPDIAILRHRIGIHVGDVFFNGDDVLGVGVNIAARLQAKAEPGGICISQTVYEVVKNNLSLEVNYCGPQELKGLPEPVPIYQVALSLPSA